MKTRFVILCQPRTGSSLLNTSLRSHPQIQMYTEILNPLQNHKLPDNGYDRLNFALRGRSDFAVGCNLHASQPSDRFPIATKWESAWRALEDDPSIRIIVLRRHDRIAQLASWKIADILSNWGDQSAVAIRPTVQIDLDELNWFIRWNETAYKVRLSFLHRHHKLEVSYESICDNWNESIVKIENFLGVDMLPIKKAVSKSETVTVKRILSAAGR